jgi:hypothetical protein
MQRNCGRVEGNDAAGTQASCIGMNPAKVIEPKGMVEVSRVIFDKRELNPSHRPPVPFTRDIDCRSRLSRRGRGQQVPSSVPWQQAAGCQSCCLLHEFPSASLHRAIFENLGMHATNLIPGDESDRQCAQHSF